MSKILQRKSKVASLIVIAVPNHYSFYESIKAQASSEVIETIELKRVTTIWSRLQFQVSIFQWLWRNRTHATEIYLEEYIPSMMLLSTSMLVFAFSKARLSLCIHNVNSWYFYSLKQKIFSIGFAKFIIRKLVTRCASCIVVVNSKMSDYVRLLENKKIIKIIPFGLTYEGIDEALTEYLFCVPGLVDESRRDYSTVLDAFGAALASNDKLKLVLLGRCKQESLSESLKNKMSVLMAKFPGSIVVFDEFVGEQEFNSYIRRSHALIGNLRPLFFTRHCVEVYGLTKETGVKVLSDANNKLCLLPRELSGYIPLNSTNYRFYGSADELANLLLSLKIRSVA